MLEHMQSVSDKHETINNLSSNNINCHARISDKPFKEISIGEEL
jgi:hypothetical protein